MTELRHDDDKQLRQELVLGLEAAICEAEKDGTLPLLAARVQNLLSAGKQSSVVQETEDFLDRAHRLDRRGRKDAALDIIYDQFDEMLLDGKFLEVDRRLAGVDAGKYSVDLLLAILTITLAAKSHLQNRAAFFARVDATLHSRGEWEAGLLIGLE